MSGVREGDGAGEVEQMWRCESCGETFDEETFSHGRGEHDPRCDGTCKPGCPVLVECGPVVALHEEADRG